MYQMQIQTKFIILDISRRWLLLNRFIYLHHLYIHDALRMAYFNICVKLVICCVEFLSIYASCVMDLECGMKNV